MALTQRQWIAGAAVLCAAIAVAYLPPKEVAYRTGWEDVRLSPERRRAESLERSLERAQQLLAAQQYRDSLARVRRAQRPQAGGTVAIAFDRSVPGSLRRTLSATLDTVWRELGPMSGDVAVQIIIRTTAARTNGGFLLPPATDGRTCVALAQLPWRLSTNPLGAVRSDTGSLAPEVRHMLGPCAYYAAFGVPGERVQRWLLQRRFDLALAIDWQTVAPVGKYDFEYWDYRWNTSLDGIACIGGDKSRCRAALFAPTHDIRPWLQVEALPPGVISGSWWYSTALYHGQSFLSDLLRREGRTRFAAFWRSSAAPDSAFRAAFGTPIEEWTAEWAAAQVGRQRYYVRPLRSTPILLSLALAGGFLAGGVLLTSRRQVR